MKRQILGQTTNQQASSLLSVTSKTSAVLTEPQIQQRLRQKRSSSYMEALHCLDAGGHTKAEGQLDALIEAITAEFPDTANLLLGIISRCYLGDPFEVHTLDMAGNIVHHYKRGEPLPPTFAKARTMALHDTYQCIEVYANYVVAISRDGQASLLPTRAGEGDG